VHAEHNSKTDSQTYFYIGRSFRVRETQASDVPVWYTWFNDPDITREMIHGIVPNTIEAQEKFRLSHIDGVSKIIFSVVATDSPTLIGTCSTNILGPWPYGHGEISLVIGNKRYHKGPLYMEITAWQLDHAFLNMNMHSIAAYASERNTVVIDTLIRLGFSKVGELRECAYRNGEYHNSVILDILKDEWLGKASSR